MQKSKVNKKTDRSEEEMEPETSISQRTRDVITIVLLVFFLALATAGFALLAMYHGSYLGMYFAVTGMIGGILSLGVAAAISVRD